PFVRFYEVNTLYGLLPKVVDDLHLIGNTATVRAEPYYIDSRVYNNPDVRSWKVNNTEVRGGSNPYELTLQRPGTNGSSRVDFRIQSMTQAIQGTTADL